MRISDQAEKIVIEYYKGKDIELRKARRGEDVGFDLKNKDETLFIEVKGSSKSEIPFRYFTNSEYEKSKACQGRQEKYEIHIVLGIETGPIKHYIIPGDVLLEKAFSETIWNLPFRREMEKYSIDKQAALSDDVPCDVTMKAL